MCRIRSVGTDKPALSYGQNPLVGACMHTSVAGCWPVKPKSPLKGFSFCGLGSDSIDTYFRGNRVGYLVDDSGEPSASANRGGGNSGSDGGTQKRHSPDYATADWRTDRAIAGFGTTRSDSLSSLGKCLASPKPKSLTGYLTHLAERFVTPESKSAQAWLWGSVALNPPFPSIQQWRTNKE